MNDDDRPDPHLRAALRHAPDADLQAPAELSARILAAARAAVAADRPPWWRRWFALPPLQLGASGAFATLVIAGVVGLLWQGQVPEPTVSSQQADLPPPPAAVAVAPEPPAASPPQVAPEPAGTNALPAPPARAPAAAERRATAAATPRDDASRLEAQASNEPQAEAAAKARAEAAAADAARAEVAPPFAVLAPPAAPPATFAKPAPAEKAAGLRAQRELDSRLAESRTAPTITTAAAAAAPPPATWRIDGADATAADARWLRELERIAGARWRSIDPPSATAAGRRVEFGDGEHATRIVLGATQVLRCEGHTAAPRCRSAELSADEARALAEALR